MNAPIDRMDVRDPLSRIIAFLAERLEPSRDVLTTIRNEHARLGAWLDEDSQRLFRASAALYPQGSKCLGTLNRPWKLGDDLDVDLVYRRDIAQTSTSTDALKRSTGDQLRRYVALPREPGDPLRPILREGRRCWSISYEAPHFHFDVLPAVPNDDARSAGKPGEPIWITDRELRGWQSSDPKGYIAWFRQRAAFRALREDMAKAAGGVDVAGIPEHEVRTTLQLVVRLMKRHRDVFYQGDPDDKPISIIITTLAARAYEKQTDIVEAYVAVLSRAESFVEKRRDGFWVPNPINADENFADKWAEHPERAVRFFEWLRRARADVESARTTTRFDQLKKSLGRAFGDEDTDASMRKYGEAVQRERDAGRLYAAGPSLTLVSNPLPGPAVRVHPHTFYGDRDD